METKVKVLQKLNNIKNIYNDEVYSVQITKKIATYRTTLPGNMLQQFKALDNYTIEY